MLGLNSAPTRSEEKDNQPQVAEVRPVSIPSIIENGDKKYLVNGFKSAVVGAKNILGIKLTPEQQQFSVDSARDSFKKFNSRGNVRRTLNAAEKLNALRFKGHLSETDFNEYIKGIKEMQNKAFISGDSGVVKSINKFNLKNGLDAFSVRDFIKDQNTYPKVANFIKREYVKRLNLLNKKDSTASRDEIVNFINQALNSGFLTKNEIDDIIYR